jgi:hypothetical protein
MRLRRIRMTETAKGAVSSTDIREFPAGSEHDLPDDLAQAFLSMGVAEPVEPAETDDPANEAQDGEAPAAATTLPDQSAAPATRKPSRGAKASK